MSIAILRAMWLGLVRDRGALMMSFVLPAVFFVIMAEIFTAMITKKTPGRKKLMSRAPRSRSSPSSMARRMAPLTASAPRR